MRNGLSPSCITLPHMRQPPWPTVLACLLERLPRVAPGVWQQRFENGHIFNAQGQAIDPHTPYAGGMQVYYWRDVPDEAPVPFEAHIVFEDEHLLVADKPHFLAVTPGGRHVHETLLVRLKQRTGLPDLSPLHRIDRETAGLVLLSKRAQDRNAYQQLFKARQVRKTYEAVAPWLPTLTWPHVHRSALVNDETTFYRMREMLADEGLAPNTETHIACAQPLHRVNAQGQPLALYTLHPITGKRHQLRVHMMSLGAPIEGDLFYPQVLHTPGEPEDYSQPLQLLCRSMALADPITGQDRVFVSSQSLALT
jgi:tRNA pseudouridine32 synthase/23S rRNA pseudouridine746 synthase